MNDKHGRMKHRERLYWYAVLGGYLLFIVYASLSYGTSEGRATAGDHLLFGIFQLPKYDSLRSFNTIKDIVLNILFYLPLGMLTASAMPQPPRRYINRWCLVGFVVSLHLEFIQSFVGRYASVSDIVTNSAGYLAGYWAVVFMMKRYGFDPLHLFWGTGAARQGKNLSAVRALYVLVFFFISLFPFDISVNPQALYRQFFDQGDVSQRLVLNPFHHFRVGDWMTTEWTLVFLGYLPLGVLTAAIDFYRKRSSVSHVILTCLLLAVVTEVSQLFILSQRTDVYNAVIAIVSGGIGWFVVKIWRRSQPEMSGTTAGASGGRRNPGLFVLLYVIFLCLLAWSPYRFELTVTAVADKIRHGSNWEPFRLHLTSHSMGSAVDLIKEMGLYIPLGVLLGLWFNERFRPAISIVLIGASCCLLSFSLELSQTICVGRYVDITDVVMATLGSLVGGGIVHSKIAKR